MHFIKHSKTFWTIIGLTFLIGLGYWLLILDDPCYEENHNGAELTYKCAQSLVPGV